MRSYALERKMNCRRFLRTSIAGLLLSTLAFASDTSFARGGGGGGHFEGRGHFGGGGHFGGAHSGFGSRGFGAVGHAFHGPIAQGGRDGGVWHHDRGGSHHSYSGYYGYYGPFDYGIDDYAGPYDDDNNSVDVQAGPTVALDESESLTIAVQKELTQLGYYHGPIDGIAGSETEHAVRWFQSIDHLPVTGQIDSATQQALRIA